MTSTYIAHKGVGGFGYCTECGISPNAIEFNPEGCAKKGVQRRVCKEDARIPRLKPLDTHQKHP